MGRYIFEVRVTTPDYEVLEFRRSQPAEFTTEMVMDLTLDYLTGVVKKELIQSGRFN